MDINKRNLNIIGMMSGTSMDGINATFVNSNGLSLERYNVNCMSAYSKETRNLLKETISNYKKFIKDVELKEYLSKLITVDHFKAVQKISKQSKIKPDLIGFHGQTIYHNPHQKISIQLGDGQLLCNLSKTPVISNFRDNDIHFGGQGAPLAPIYHQLLMKQLNLEKPSCFINIGGISNLTFYNKNQLLGFDTGPGNCLMDSYMQNIFGLEYDDKGRLASKGNVISNIKNLILKLSNIDKNYPKSLDRKDFNGVLELVYNTKLNSSDVMATFSEATCLSILKSIKQLPETPKNITIMGGGSHNLFLMKKLKDLSAINVKVATERNLPGDFIEAELIAFLSARSLFNIPITFPETTGVNKPMIGGKKFILN